MTDLPPLDLAGLSRRLDGDEPLLRELLQLFVATAPDAVCQLRTSWETAGVAQTKRVVHQFRGSAAAVGALHLLHLLDLLDALLSEGSMTGGCATLDEVAREVERIGRFIADLQQGV